MKINAQQYARGLYELLEKKSKDEAKILLIDFVNFLAKNNDINKANEIIFQLEEIIRVEKGELEIELTSARVLAEESDELIKLYLKRKSGVKNVRIKERIKPDIIGGFIIRYNDKVIDGSLKQNLLYFQKQLDN
jgi:F-type H+-transporting ATPase subunit delta